MGKKQPPPSTEKEIKGWTNYLYIVVVVAAVAAGLYKQMFMEDSTVANAAPQIPIVVSANRVCAARREDGPSPPTWRCDQDLEPFLARAENPNDAEIQSKVGTSRGIHRRNVTCVNGRGMDRRLPRSPRSQSPCTCTHALWSGIHGSNSSTTACSSTCSRCGEITGACLKTGFP